MHVCPGCGYENKDQDRFCGWCSAPLKAQRHRGTELAGAYRIEHVFSSVPGGWIYNGQDIRNSKVVRIKEYVGAAGIFTEVVTRVSIMKNLARSLGVIDYFMEGEDLFIIFEPSDSITLEEKMQSRDGKAFPAEEAMNFMRTILMLIGHFHTQDLPLYFGDLTPASFALMADSALILRDPGICVFLTKRDTRRAFGKNSFSAPEVSSRGDIIAASDIYSIGCIMYYLLTNRKSEEVCLAQFNIRAKHKLNVDVPIELEKLLQSMISENSASRPGTIEKILRQLDKLQKKQNPAEPHLNRGIAAFNQGMYARAIQEFKRAALLDPGWSMPYFWQGMTQYKTREYEKAVNLFNRTLDLDPEYQSAYYHRGSSHLNLGNNDEAKSDFDLALAINPSDSRAYYGRAMVFKNLQQYKNAEKDFNYALKLDPENPEIYLWRALTRYEAGLLDSALDDFNTTLEMDKNNAYAYLGRGLAWNGKGNKYNALDDINRAILINPNYEAAYLERGILLCDMMRWTLSLEDLNFALSKDPENPDGLFYRAKVNFRLRDYKQVVEDLNKFIEMEPGVAEAYKIRCDARRRNGDLEGADTDEEMYKTLKVSGDG